MYKLNPNYATAVKHDIDKLLISSRIHSTSKGGYMVITHNGSTQKEWKIENLCGFQKVE